MSHVDKELNRYTISVHGYEMCKKILADLHLLEYGSVLYEAALSFAIVLYARPFSENQKNIARAAPRVKSKNLLKAMDTYEKELHEKLVHLRNCALAHAEWQSHPTSISKSGVISTMPFSIVKEVADSEVLLFAKLVDKLLPIMELERASRIAYCQYVNS